MTVRDCGAAPVTTLRPPAQPRHFGRGASFIDEYQALGIKVGLFFEPRPASLGDIRPLLFGCVRGFF